MAKIFPVVRKIKQIAGGIVNFPARVFAGVAQYSRFIIVEGHKVAAGFIARLSPFAVTAQQLPAFEVLQTSIALVNRSPVLTASESAGSDWDNIASFEGQANADTATLTEGLVLTQGTLIGTFPDQLNRGGLTIEKVEIIAHYRVGNFLLVGTTLTLNYRAGGALGAAVQLDQHIGGVVVPTNVNRLDGHVFDITANGPDGLGGAWSWDDLSGLRIELQGTILVDTGLSIVEADAAVLRITASSIEGA